MMHRFRDSQFRDDCVKYYRGMRNNRRVYSYSSIL